MRTLRPTRLSDDSNRKDYTVHQDGEAIGRIYEDPAASRPELRWFWSITVLFPERSRVKTDGRTATFEEAKAQFAECWRRVADRG